MSWLLLNLCLAVEVLIVYMVSINVRNMNTAIHNVRVWMMPFPDELLDIREEMSRFMDDVQDNVMHTMNNFRYIMVTATLAVYANMMGEPVAWLPFLASIGYALESVLDLYKINVYGNALNMNTAHAEQTVAERATQHDYVPQDETDG